MSSAWDIGNLLAVEGAPAFDAGILPARCESLQSNLETHFFWMLRNWMTYESRLTHACKAERWLVLDDERSLPNHIGQAVQERFHCAPSPDALLEALSFWVRANGRTSIFDGLIFEVIDDAWDVALQKARIDCSPGELSEKVAALQRFSAYIPDEARRLLISCGNPDNSNYLLRCVAWVRGMGELFRTNPQLAILWLSGVDRIDFSSAASILHAEEQLARGARNLLADIGLPAERLVMKVLRKIPLNDLKKIVDYYPETLKSVSALPFFWQRVQSVAVLPHSLIRQIDRYRAIPSLGILNDIAKEYQEVGESWDRSLPSMDILADTLRMLAPTGECRRVENMQNLEHLRRLHDRLAAERVDETDDDHYVVNQEAFPVTPPIKPDNRITALTTVDEIVAAGRAFHNCCRFYLSDVSLGRYFIYTIKIGSERAMLGMERDAYGEWVVQQLYGPHNAQVSHHMDRFVGGWLKRAKKAVA